jgi:membrane fusion protein, heavy metal efflux system
MSEIIPHGGFVRTVRNVGGFIPTLLVMSAIAALAWWGHAHNWKMPKASVLRGEEVENDDWCKDHNVPESVCVECHPDLLSKSKSTGWCNTHGIPDCTLCPSGSAAELEQAKYALDFAPRPTNLKACKLHERRIQLADAESVTKSGIQTELVGTASERDPVVEFISAPGEIGYDQTKVAHLSSRSPGGVVRVFKRLGDKVKQGEVLAIIEAAEVGKAKSELLIAFGLFQLKSQILDSIKSSSGAVPELRMREAEAAVRETELRLDAARQTLVNLGLTLDETELRLATAEQLKFKLHFLAIPPDVTAGFDPKKTTSSLLPLLAPMDGTIVSRDVVIGEIVDLTKTLFELVDTSSLWLTLDVKSEDAAKLKLEAKQVIRFKSDATAEELTGTIAWISTQADLKTRTVKIRANLADSAGQQKANTFGTGRVILREEPVAIVVPNAAVHFEGCCNVVFVCDKDFSKEGSLKVFNVRKVRIGAKDDRRTEIIAGLRPGERIVTTGSGMLLSELLRGGLGEGCACHGAK